MVRVIGKKKIFAAAIIICALLLSVGKAFAYTVPANTTVYVTPTGECYHREGCTYIRESYRALTISSAAAAGYRACSRCDADELTGAYGSTWKDGGETNAPSSGKTYTVPANTTVYITPTGDCYHRSGCSYIKGSCQGLKISSAVAEGYRACSRCNPDELTGNTGAPRIVAEAVEEQIHPRKWKRKMEVGLVGLSR